MTIAIAARKIACEVLVLVLPITPSLTITNSRTAMARDFSAALFQLGGLRSRAARASAREPFFCSSGVGLRPVRPRVSIDPAALPRCLVRLLRFVWAMELTRVDDLRAV